MIRLFAATLLLLVSTATLAQQRPAPFTAKRPFIVKAGPEIGTYLTPYLDAAPTVFPIRYPYADPGDTIHLRFGEGSPVGLFGFALGYGADVAYSPNWGVLFKLIYNERRANWHETVMTPCGETSIPIRNDFTLMLRYASFEVMSRYTFDPDGFYGAAGFSLSNLLSNHYDVEQELVGNGCSFIDRATGEPTGYTKYGVGYSFEHELNGFAADLEALLGYSIRVADRWTLNPELGLRYPLANLFTSTAREDIAADGVTSAPRPLPISLTVAARFEY